MPICTTCTKAAPYLYTTYESDYNLRLEQCSGCQSFVDPYVEYDSLTLFIDLILLKRGVYRHLLYNRGAEPRRLGGNPTEPKGVPAQYDREWRRWKRVLELGSSLIFLDAYIRWSYLNPSPESTIWTEDMLKKFARVLGGTIAETLAFHLGVMLVCCLVLRLIDRIRCWKPHPHPQSDIRREFKLSLIPLTLFYASLTKYFLLFLLTIWLPASQSPAPSQPLPPWTQAIFPNSTIIRQSFHLLDDDVLDREWLVRNVLGGMSAGFGLRVILDDIHPLFTTLIILCGWGAKTVASNAVCRWVGRDPTIQEAWLAYSIP